MLGEGGGGGGEVRPESITAGAEVDGDGPFIGLGGGRGDEGMEVGECGVDEQELDAAVVRGDEIGGAELDDLALQGELRGGLASDVDVAVRDAADAGLGFAGGAELGRVGGELLGVLRAGVDLGSDDVGGKGGL